MEKFKVMDAENITDIPWDFAETFREKAEANHGQTLERLNERGGLCPYEILCAIRNQGLFPLRGNSRDENDVVTLLADWENGDDCGEWVEWD